MVTRLLGRKVGMTQIYTEKGQAVSVTVVEAGPCTVLQVKTVERDGYAALQIGFGKHKLRNVPRSEIGHIVPRDPAMSMEDRRKQVAAAAKDRKTSAPDWVAEVPWDGKEAVKVGDSITCSIFENWKKIDVVGLSKGRGFMGVVRRWGFHGLPATHGMSDRERAPGSLGRQHSISQGVYPGGPGARHPAQPRPRQDQPRQEPRVRPRGRPGRQRRLRDAEGVALDRAQALDGRLEEDQGPRQEVARPPRASPAASAAVRC
jgi:large subunit ribosomal protein L3